MTVAVGNHESAQEAWGDSLPKRLVSSYFTLFAQEEGEPARQPSARNSYHSHKIGPALGVVVLDSRHVVDYESQVPWLTQQLSNSSLLGDCAIKLVAYHMPLYSEQDTTGGCQFGLVGSYYARAVRSWARVFEEYNVTAAFEHHVHLFKRTKPIFQSRIANQSLGERGVVYLGGGAWGAPVAGGDHFLEGPGVISCSEQQMQDPRVCSLGWFLDTASRDYNLWHGVLVPARFSAFGNSSEDHIELELRLRAFNQDNKTLDELVLSPAKL
eukprot:gb/GEZN01015311.1/.p1 GENE.gb/GEZN01015311.1/~~gb/GEZN01015311.1/.p1  ORF type:complete len:283 (-),score=23.30 gb/GEZN01015311.1/:55-861(-)